MTIKRLFFIFGFACLIVFRVSAQEPKDTIEVQDTSFIDSLFVPSAPNDIDTAIYESFRFSQNLDSLLLFYYVEKSMAKYGGMKFPYTDSVIPDFPDSIIEKRLRAIPSYMPLTYNEKVRAYIDVYTKRKRAQVEIMLGLSECYFPVFEEALDYYGMPYELKYLPVIESALNPKAISRAGAVGMWQFMYPTGRIYNLEVNTFVDERLDPYKSTYAAARYLRDLHKIYNDWMMALAAYNCGPGNVNKAIRRSKGKTTYWEIYNYLPKETRGYVPAFIAATYAMTYYQEHNLLPRPIEIDVTDTVLIDQELHIQQIADVLNLSADVIRDLNPQYKKDIIPAKGKIYTLRLPLEYTTKFIDLEDSIYAYHDSVYFGIACAKLSAKYPEVQVDPAHPDLVKLTYKVRSGDNLGYIADKYDVTLTDIKKWNNLKRSLIKVGQKIIIYKHQNVADKYMAFSYGAPKAVQTNCNSTSTVTTASEDGYVYYTVRSGDTFWSISQKFPGVTNKDIMDLNNIQNARSLKVGQKLKIMKKS